MLALYGQLVKLKIIGYKNPKYFVRTGYSYTALLNPQEFSENYNVEYNAAQAFGVTGADLKFQRVEPQELKLNFLFDATGVVKEQKSLFGNFATPFFGSSGVSSVATQIKKFKRAAADYIGDIHSVPYVKIIWGDFIFKGRLQNLEITYTLFKSDGTPLRAKAATTFKRSVTDSTRERQENKSSPDLTHIRTVGAGDTLPAMAKSIYGDDKYLAHCITLARQNGLKHFRDIKIGQKISFPPLP